MGDGRQYDGIDLEKGATKERKAAAYMAAGQDITVLTETDFLKLIYADCFPASSGAPLDFVKAEADDMEGLLLAEVPAVVTPLPSPTSTPSWGDRKADGASLGDAAATIGQSQELSAGRISAESEYKEDEPAIQAPFERANTAGDVGLWGGLARLFRARRD